jgi:hypothetical protein
MVAKSNHSSNRVPGAGNIVLQMNLNSLTRLDICLILRILDIADKFALSNKNSGNFLPVVYQKICIVMTWKAARVAM